MSKRETGLHYPIALDLLPETWSIGHVGDFASEVQPGFASGKHNKEGAGVPHLRPFNIDRQGRLDLTEIKSVAPDANPKRLHDGDVLFNNTNSPELVGKTAVISSAGDWGFSNHMTRIRLKDDVAPKFAAYQLHYLWMSGYFLHNCVKHVNQASVSSKALARTVPFVAPTREMQDCIVAEIEKQFSRLDEAVANLKRVNANLKRYKAAVLKAAVEGKLTEEWRKAHPGVEPASKLLDRILAERRTKWEEAELAKMDAKGKAPKNDKWKAKYKEPAAPDITSLPELPEGWVWASAEQISGFVTKGTTPSADKLSADSGEVQFLKVYNLTFDGVLNYGYKPAFVSRQTHDVELARSKVQAGDVLINIVGPPLGQVAVVPLVLPEANINQAIARFRPIYPVGSDFLSLALMSEVVMGWAISRAKTTAGQSNLTLEICRELPIPLPSSPEQSRIVAISHRHLSLIRETETQVDTNLKRAERLRQSVLAQAFAGRLPGLEGAAAAQPDVAYGLDRVAESRAGYEATT